jgi:integrase
MIHKQTERSLRAFIKSGRKGLLNDGGGLYAAGDGKGNLSFVHRFQLNGGKTREMGLGAFHTISLADARETARLNRLLLHEGKDPIVERNRTRIARLIANRASTPFEFCAREYIESRAAGWGTGTSRQDWEGSLGRYVYPVIGKILVADLTTEHVLSVLQPHWETKTETMMRVRGRIEAIVDMAIAKKFRSAPNPAVWKANLDALLDRKVRKAPVHLAALDYHELPGLVAELGQIPSVTAQALSFCVHTVLRSGEVRLFQWDHIAADRQSITLPPEVMKMERPHRVPLTAAARAIIDGLEAVRTASPYVFTSGTKGQPLARQSMLDLLKKLRPDAAVTVHGTVRAGFATWRADETSFSEELAEASLAHIKKDRIAEAYNRGTMFRKRIELMEAWGRFLSRPIGGNVAPLRKVV